MVICRHPSHVQRYGQQSSNWPIAHANPKLSPCQLPQSWDLRLLFIGTFILSTPWRLKILTMFPMELSTNSQLSHLHPVRRPNIRHEIIQLRGVTFVWPPPCSFFLITAKIRWLQHLFSGSSNKTLSRVKRIIPSFLFQSPRPWVVLYGHPPKSQARLGAWINFSCLALMAPFCVSRILSTSVPRGKSWECLVQGPSHSLPMRETIFRSPIHKNGSIVSLGFSSKYHPSGPSGVSKKEAATKHGLTNRTFLYLTGEFQWSLTMFRPTVVAGLPMCCGSILMFAGSRHVYWKSLIFRVGSCHSSR